MTLLYVDSFDHYDTIHIESKGWGRSFPAGSHEIALVSGRRATNCLSNDSSSNGTSIVHNISSSSSAILGCAMNITGTFGSNRTLLAFQNDSGAVHCQLVTTGSDQLQLRIGSDPSSGTVLDTTGASAFPLGAYSYYEFKLIPSDQVTGGLVEVKKDGLVILTSTAANTLQADLSIASFQAAKGYNASVIFTDDLYCLNLEGSDNNDYLGDVRVDALFSDNDGATVNFVPNVSGGNHEMVDDTTIPDDDATFVEAGTITDRDLYSVDSASLGTEIHGVQQCVLSRKTDAGTVNIAVITEKPGGSGERTTIVDSTASETYNYNLGVLESDPDDSTVWTDGKINATEYGFRVDNIIT